MNGPAEMVLASISGVGVMAVPIVAIAATRPNVPLGRRVTRLMSGLVLTRAVLTFAADVMDILTVHWMAATSCSVLLDLVRVFAPIYRPSNPSPSDFSSINLFEASIGL
jgi:hypothetical protein